MIKGIVITLAVLVGLVAATPVAAHATTSPLSYQAAACGEGVANFLFLKPWDACLTRDSNGAPQLKSLSSLWLIVLVLIEDGIKAAGYVAAGFVTWGGIKYLKSQGDPGQLTEARQVIYNALFGLVLALLSVAIVNFVAGAIN